MKTLRACLWSAIAVAALVDDVIGASAASAASVARRPGQKAKPADVELFENGDFEDGLKGWRTLNLSGGASFEPDKQSREQGKWSLRIERSESGASGKRDFLKQNAQLPGAEGQVTLELSYKVDKGSQVSINAYFNDAQGEFVGRGTMAVAESGRTKKFVRFSETWEVPAQAVGFGINVMLDAPGSVWIDAVSVRFSGQIAGTAEQLVNGGFEDGLEGWRPLRGDRNAAEVGLSRRVKAAGKAALEIERDDPRLWPPDGVESRVALGGRKRAELRFAWRTKDSARATVVLQAYAENGVALATVRRELESAAEFASGELELELPKGAHELLVQLEVCGSGTVWFDELELAGGQG